MTDSLEDAFFLERATREINELNDIDALREMAKQILALHLKYKQVTNKLLLDK